MNVWVLVLCLANDQGSGHTDGKTNTPKNTFPHMIRLHRWHPCTYLSGQAVEYTNQICASHFFAKSVDHTSLSPMNSSSDFWLYRHIPVTPLLYTASLAYSQHTVLSFLDFCASTCWYTVDAGSLQPSRYVLRYLLKKIRIWINLSRKK
jgi:hypothetical protein